MNPATIGGLRRRLTIEAPTRTSDEAGAAVLAWSSLGDVWAAILPRDAHEIVSADSTAARVTHEIEMRWRGDISGAMRLRENGAIYLIHATYERDPRRRRLVCLVEELAP